MILEPVELKERKVSNAECEKRCCRKKKNPE
jgi:hypothetical protein